MSKIYPVLLAGGSGTRLWPLSRKSYPKQFSNVIGNKSLFQESALRLMSSKHVEFLSHITVTNSDFRFIVSEQLKSLKIDSSHILIEPETKNTASAILAATLFVFSKNSNAILLVAPSDHVITNTETFHKAVKVGLNYVQDDKIITFGITPTGPETGYGYIELDKSKLDSLGSSNILNFVEKPNLSSAQKMIKLGNYLWNAGIFMFKAKNMIEAYKKFQPVMFELTKLAVDTAEKDLEFLRLNPEPWKKIENNSIDYAIMEKANNLIAIPYESKWSDLGGWDAVWSNTHKDNSGNALSHNAHAINCFNSLLRSENKNQQIVGLGLNDTVAIAMPDAVLVTKKDKAQDVKQIVDYLKVNKISQAEVFPKDHRPWGWFECLSSGTTFKVKRIYVNPGESLSLQSHKFRSEHWIIVEGTAKVTINEEVKILIKGQSVDIPLGAIHRLENPYECPMVLIEVQLGSYLGEDDIIRYQDAYSRI